MQAVIRITHEVRVDISDEEMQAVDEGQDPDVEESLIERAREALAEHEQTGGQTRGISTETDLMGFEE